ncbi:MAG: hypothetical protein ACI8PZ_004385 [Myxococcota bacterium]|jgi:hypothetical protein
MGANHLSQTVLGADPAAVRALLVQWMRTKGYDLRPGTPRTALDAEHERAVWLAWRDDRTVLLGNAIQELPRQLFELKKLGAPVLELWMHDSDLWGYQLWREGKCAAAFNSQPRYFGPPEPPEGPNDVALLCRVTGAVGEEPAVKRLQAKRALFAESVSAELAALLGIAPAAAQYDPPGQMHWATEGFDTEHLWFRRAGWDPMAGFDLAGVRFETWEPPTHPDLTPTDRATIAWHQGIGRTVGLSIGCLFAPLGWLFRGITWWRSRAPTEQLEASDATAPVAASVDPDVEHLDGRLVNRRHGVEVTLPSGARVETYHLAGGGPGSVLRFGVGETQVACQALVPSELRWLTKLGPHGTTVTDTTTDGVRTVVATHASGESGQWRVLSLRTGPEAVYVVQAGGLGATVPDDVADAVRAVAEGLTWL